MKKKNIKKTNILMGDISSRSHYTSILTLENYKNLRRLADVLHCGATIVSSTYVCIYRAHFRKYSNKKHSYYYIYIIINHLTNSLLFFNNNNIFPQSDCSLYTYTQKYFRIFTKMSFARERRELYVG